MTSPEGTAAERTPPWWSDHLLLLIVGVAIVLRLTAITEPMRFDESVTYVEFVLKPWSAVVGSYPYPNNHVLFSLLAKLTSSLAPMQPWAIRLPALLAGVAIVPLTYAVGRKLLGRTEALLGAALAAAATPLVLYSVNARGYSLLAALFLVELLLVHRLRARPTAAGWVVVAIVAALGAFTIPIMLYPHGIIGVWLVLDWARRRSDASRAAVVGFALASAGAAVLALLLYLPIIRSQGWGALVGNKFVEAQSWASFASQLPRSALGTLLQWSMPLPLWLAPIALVLAVVGVMRSRRARRGSPSLLLASALWCLLLLLATHRVPFMRIWIFLLPLYCLAVGSGIAALAERARTTTSLTPLLAPILAAAIAALSLASHSVAAATETGAFPDAPAVTAALKPRLRDGDRVLAPIPTNGPLLFYFVASQMKTGYLSTNAEAMRRAFIVLDTTRGQSLGWAVRQGMIDPRRFAPPRLVGRFGRAELWVTDAL